MSMRRALVSILLIAAAGSAAARDASSDGSRAPTEPLAISAALAEAMNAKLVVSQFYFTQGQFPSDLAETSYTPLVTPSLGPNGVIRLELRGVDTSTFGKSLLLTPSRSEDGAINWTCSSPDIPVELLPQDCR
jgi:hypothetical protein